VTDLARPFVVGADRGSCFAGGESAAVYCAKISFAIIIKHMGEVIACGGHKFEDSSNRQVKSCGSRKQTYKKDDRRRGELSLAVVKRDEIATAVLRVPTLRRCLG
jgi:hypothetical protein